MQRDKRGRFVKKATAGTSISLNNPNGMGVSPVLNFGTKKIRWNYKDGLMVDEYGKVITAVDLGNPNYVLDRTLSVTPNFLGDKYTTFNVPSLNTSTSSISANTQTTPVETSEEEDPSAGMNLTGDKSGKGSGGKGLNIKPFDRTKMADFLELTRAGITAAVNNKIADRALEAEKPFLQDVSESHRSVYGDYRSQIQGEKAAAQLRNMASKPLTSDGALQQQMMMEAQIKGQEYIDQGNAKDDAMRRQTQEVTWQQEKENQQQRQAVAMQNKQAMLMSEKNKTQIENMRDSANYSQVVEQYLGAQEQRLRNKGAEQEYYQEYYDDALVQSDVWNTYREGFTESQKQLLNTYNSGTIADWDTYLNEDAKRASDWVAIRRAMQNEIIRKKAALKGVTINPASLNKPTTSSYGIFGSGTNLFEYKKGGTVYKARLTKRTRDNDRGARSLESSRKIAARFLEKAIDSLYDYNDVELIAKPKRKKRKYQSGGGLPFVGFTPVFATSEKEATTSTKTSKADKEDKEDLITKEVLALLKDMDGLPADMQLIVSSLKNFSLQDSNDPLGLYSSSDIASRYISLINKVKLAKFNREEYNNAFNQLKSNGGLHELAITSEGMLVGTNEEGDFEYFSPEEISKGKHTENGYSLLTNSNLLYLRANSLDAAFNHRLTTFAQNGIGMETVNKLINDSISNLGSMQDSQEGYVKAKNGELIKGLQEFYDAMEASGGNFDGTINDLYKYKYLTKSQAEQAKKTMQYVYQTLPENAKSLLKVKSDGSDAGAIKLIETLISSKVDSQAQLDIDLKGGPTAKSLEKSKSETDKSNPYLQMIREEGGQPRTFTIVPEDTNNGFQVTGTFYSALPNVNEEMSIDALLATGMLPITGNSRRSISFGDQLLDSSQLDDVMFDNEGGAIMTLPIITDQLGNIKVNMGTIEDFNTVQKEMKNYKNLPKQEYDKKYAELLQKYELYEYIDHTTGLPDLTNTAQFLVIGAYTTDKVDFDKNSKFIKKVKHPTKDLEERLIKGLSTNKEKDNYKIDIDDTWGFFEGFWDDIYRANVFIPLNQNPNAAINAWGDQRSEESVSSSEQLYQSFNKLKSMKPTYEIE